MAKSHSNSCVHASVPRALCALVFLSVAACADESAAADSASLASMGEAPAKLDGGDALSDANTESAESGASNADDAGHVLREPKGAYVASITANGTGCPAGTWDANLAADGTTYDITFSAFYVEVDRATAVSIKNCVLGFRLHAPEGLSYTVSDAMFAGGMYLEDGVQVRFQTRYWFQGHPDEGDAVRTDIAGPRDEPFLFEDTREDVNLIRSRCGTDEQLNVDVTMRLLNSAPRRNGFVWIEEIPTQSLKIAWKRC